MYFVEAWTKIRNRPLAWIDGKDNAAQNSTIGGYSIIGTNGVPHHGSDSLVSSQATEEAEINAALTLPLITQSRQP